MSEGPRPVSTQQETTDDYGTELATRLAEHAHDMNRNHMTYKVVVQGQQWQVDVTNRMALAVCSTT